MRPISSFGEAVEIAREGQHQRDLHQLGRLQLDDAEIDPALRAHADNAAHIDRDDQRQRDPRRSNRPRGTSSGCRRSAAAIIGMSATAKRIICFAAQGCMLPLAAE